MIKSQQPHISTSYKASYLVLFSEGKLSMFIMFVILFLLNYKLNFHLFRLNSLSGYSLNWQQIIVINIDIGQYGKNCDHIFSHIIQL